MDKIVKITDEKTPSTTTEDDPPVTAKSHPDGANPRHPSIPSDPSLFTVSTMVVVQMMNHPPLHGIIRWMGTLPNHDGYYAGVELVC